VLIVFQLDLEMSFATRTEVMNHVQNMLKSVWKTLSVPYHLGPHPITYTRAMSRYGSDKPDLRFGSRIYQVTNWFSSAVIGKLTSLEKPAVDMMKIDMQCTSPDKSRAFVRKFLDNPTSSAYLNNPAGMPGVTVYDPSKPLRGLASFEHEGAAKIEQHFKPETGDIFIVQTRPDRPLTGGSTPLGDIRRDINIAAITEGLVKTLKDFVVVWVVDFPLFSPLEESDPGQGGMAGICSTHHPFTAPKPGQDLSKLITEPLTIIGDHYDLVINGVEVGGGSRRIHTADMQELVFRDVLQMKPDRIENFRHLLNALGSGCPPHAGFALGFDRLIALMTGRQSVRDVIAFPKSADGEDKFVGSPSPLTHEQLATYHLKTAETGPEASSNKISIKA
jgi:aspartyl-tRNA synthetase